MSLRTARKAHPGPNRRPSNEKKGRAMKQAENTNGPAPADGDIHEGANVEKIRDILFGSQMRDYDKRFARLEERLSRDALALREELKKRLDTLEAFVQQEVESLSQRIKNEKSERTDGLKDLDREMHESTKSLEKKVAHLDDELAKGTVELRARILEQSKALMAEVEGKHREMSASLDREVQTLTADKTDRKALADLFTELALRLKDEFELPEGK
jgi:hypothetical protein